MFLACACTFSIYMLPYGNAAERRQAGRSGLCAAEAPVSDSLSRLTTAESSQAACYIIAVCSLSHTSAGRNPQSPFPLQPPEGLHPSYNLRLQHRTGEANASSASSVITSAAQPPPVNPES
ncbi:hypothetical protein BC834DRAFT_905557 [Gloeopeniophorella convolvens]|nr:hypothetical protein BC834DRAFT_905557 [Gloeopeniophorella convolvens]